MRTSPEIYIPIKLRRVLSAIIAISLISVFIIVLQNRIYLFEENRDEIERLRISIAALAMSAKRPENSLSKSLFDFDLADFFAKDLDVGSNHIQKIVKNLNETLGTNDIQIDSVRILPPIEEGVSITARASVTMTVSYDQIFNIINTIESSMPVITIDAVRINNRKNNNLLKKNNSTEEKNTTSKNRVNLTLVLKVYSRKSQNHNNKKNITNNLSEKEGLSP